MHTTNSILVYLTSGAWPAGVAQWLGHLTWDPKLGGSNPAIANAVR
jgi:hypothetical protein